MKDRELVFYSLLDFYPKKDKIKEHFEKLSIDDRLIYRMYVFCLSFEEEYVKDLIWEYLNGYDESIGELAKKYRQKKEKYEKKRLKEQEKMEDIIEWYR